MFYIIDIRQNNPAPSSGSIPLKNGKKYIRTVNSAIQKVLRNFSSEPIRKLRDSNIDLLAGPALDTYGLDVDLFNHS